MNIIWILGLNNAIFVYIKLNYVDRLKLWQNIQSGDVNALHDLHKRYFHPMCLFAFKSINDHQQVEHIVSDCFLKIWKKRKNIEIKSSLESYLYQMLRNSIIDYHRAKHDNTISFDQIPDIPDEAEMNDEQRYAKLYTAISKLPEKRRHILELAIFESCTYQEIAEKLGITKNTVKTQMVRAYRFLKESLDPVDFFFFCFLKKR
nr:sigma-70 family RNA polymerase sigma factor [uncultured Draconibacterium sp.]